MTLYYHSVSERLEGLAREAIEAAACSGRALAEEARLHPVTLARWRTGVLGVSAKSALRLAHALEARALRLMQIASRLRAQAELEKGVSDE